MLQSCRNLSRKTGVALSITCTVALGAVAGCGAPDPSETESGEGATGSGIFSPVGDAGAGPTTGAGFTTSTGGDPSGSGAGLPNGPSPSGGAGGGSNGVVVEFGSDATRKLTVVGTAADGLDRPRDLEWNPDHPDQLWTANAGFQGAVIYFGAGTAGQVAEAREDYFAGHFMANVSSLAFGTSNQFATCQESRDDWNGDFQPEDDFMGPTLWTADLDVFAATGQGDGTGEGSHIDMLHESPLCMGIAFDRTNIYWAFDGLNGHIVYYDFASDHGPGGSDHADGIVRRYIEATVTRVEGVPSHMALDHGTGALYVVDTGAGRVMRLDTHTGEVTGIASDPHEYLAEYTEVTGAAWTTFASGLQRPSGIALGNQKIFVSDHQTGDIVAFDLAGGELGRIHTGAQGLMGISLGPDGKLWFVDGLANTLVRIDP